jgi:hypothetical protein
MVLLGKLWKTLAKTKIFLALQGFSADRIAEIAVFSGVSPGKKFSLLWG